MGGTGQLRYSRRIGEGISYGWQEKRIRSDQSGAFCRGPKRHFPGRMRNWVFGEYPHSRAPFGHLQSRRRELPSTPVSASFPVDGDSSQHAALEHQALSNSAASLLVRHRPGSLCISTSSPTPDTTLGSAVARTAHKSERISTMNWAYRNASIRSNPGNLLSCATGGVGSPSVVGSQLPRPSDSCTAPCTASSAHLTRKPESSNFQGRPPTCLTLTDERNKRTVDGVGGARTSAFSLPGLSTVSPH